MNIQINIWLKYSFELCFPVWFCKTYQDMFIQEFNCQKIFKQEWSMIDNTYFFPNKNQARRAIPFFLTKQESSNKLIEKSQSRSRWKCWHHKLEIKHFKQDLLFSERTLMQGGIFAGIIGHHYNLLLTKFRAKYAASFIGFHKAKTLSHPARVEYNYFT